MGYLCRHSAAVFFLLFFFPVFGSDAIKDGGFDLPPVSSESELRLPVGLNDGFSAKLTDHFLIAHDTTPAEAKKLADQLETGFQNFRIFFEKAGFELQLLQERLAWIHFSDSEHYSSYALRADKMDLSHLRGYYSAKTNRVAIIGPHSGGSTDTSEPVRAVQSFDIAAMAGDETDMQSVKVAHELAHQLAFNTGLQKRGVMYPLWVSEGLATQFETELSCCSNNTARKDRLLKMRARGRLIPLDEFISITRLPVGQAMGEDIYAQAWGFFNFLLKSRPRQLKNYMDVLCNVQPGFRPSSVIYKEFTDSFGSPDLLYKEWIRSVYRQ